MKQSFLFLFSICMLSTATLSAQHRVGALKVPVSKKVPVPNKLAVTGFEVAETPVSPSVPPASGLLLDSRIGGTTYDLQSNQLTGNRIHYWGDNKVSAVWCQSLNPLESSGFPDRGTGYNTNASGAWNAEPTAKLESIRTGFPSYFVDNNQIEWIVSHASGGTAPLGAKFKVHWAKRGPGELNWTEGDVPYTTPYGGLWARIAVGGLDNNTLHVIYLTTPATNVNSTNPPANATLNGVNGAIRYSRSTDGGVTWDIVDATIPGLDDTNWNNHPADGYSLDVSGNTVALAVFGFNDDCVLVKSSDNGTTWDTYRTVNKFVKKKWEFDDGYTIEDALQVYREDLAPVTASGPDTLAILTSDGNGHLMLDPSGKAHVFFPGLYVSDPDTIADGSLNWYENYNVGIVYWNEDMADHAGYPVAGWADFDGDGAWGSTDGTINIYDGYGFEATTTSPSAGLGADGTIYLTYSALHELNLDADGLHLYQPLTVKSAPGDYKQWSGPLEVFGPDLTSDYEITRVTENFYPSMARGVDDHIHMIVQQDFTTGLITRITGNQEALDNAIVYQNIPVLLYDEPIPVVRTKEPKIQGLSVAPNPASNFARISLNAENASKVAVEVFNGMGVLVMTQHSSAVAGTVNIDLNTSKLSNGIHYVRVNTGAAAGTIKLMVAK
jgi:Secretion system C-terminal sorting domain